MLYFENKYADFCCLATNNRQWNLTILRKLRIEAGPINLICCLYNF